MSAAQLAKRLRRSDVNDLGRRAAILPEHRLVFEKVSSTKPSIGYANVVGQPGDRVEGVLYEMNLDFLERLDRIELVPAHYIRISQLVMDISKGVFSMAHVYVANPAAVRDGLSPDPAYLDLLLEGGDLLSPFYRQRLADKAQALRTGIPCQLTGSNAWP